MAKPTARSEMYDLYRRLYHSTSIEKEYIVRALQLQLDQVKDKLVTASDTNAMIQLQGEAKALDKIIGQLTTAPVNEQE